jgi:hypothetical protein
MEVKNTKNPNQEFIKNLIIPIFILDDNITKKLFEGGKQVKYNYNNGVFLNEIKNYIFTSKKLKLGIKQKDRVVEENNPGKINEFFEETIKQFDISKNWSYLTKSKNISENIKSNLSEDKLNSHRIKNIYFLGPNKTQDDDIDFAIELQNGSEFFISINRNPDKKRVKSLNNLFDLLVGGNTQKIFSSKYKDSWDKLSREWFQLIYDNTHQEYKDFIKNFINPDMSFSLTWTSYLKLDIQKKENKILGKYFPLLNKNFKKLSVLLSYLYKRPKAFENYSELKNNWNFIKDHILFNEIIEDYLISSVREIKDKKIQKNSDGFYRAEGLLKDRFIRLLIYTIDLKSISKYDFSSSDFKFIPSKESVRNNYNNIDILFNFHKSKKIDDKQINIRFLLKERPIFDIDIEIIFTGGEMGKKLGANIDTKVHNNTLMFS